MPDKFSRPQIQIIAQYLAGIFQKVVKPLYLESQAQAKALDRMRQIGPDVSKAIDVALNDARLSLYAPQELDQEYRVALEKALQTVFGDSQNAEVLKELRNGLGLPT